MLPVSLCMWHANAYVCQTAWTKIKINFLYINILQTFTFHLTSVHRKTNTEGTRTVLW